MAACCSGSFADIIHGQPHGECWSLPVKPVTDEDRYRQETHRLMRQSDALDTSTIYCPCGSSETWGQRDHQWIDDAWLDAHASHVRPGHEEDHKR
jgi:hypothetical protein